MGSVGKLVEEQIEANVGGTFLRSSFEGHRKKVTALLAERARTPEARLCLLGAGNANDIELDTLLERYAEIHLVDLDPDALARAALTVTGPHSKKLVRHAPVDVSGVLDKLERWSAMQLTPEELMGHPQATATALLRATGGPFDVVASTCILTQIQRAPVAVLGDAHRLFEAVRHTLTVTHVRVLHALTRPGGSALFVTDVSADRITSLPDDDPNTNFAPLVSALVLEGNVFQVAQPDLIRSVVKDDPVLSKDIRVSPVLDAWFWLNGPDQRFLVYALELELAARPARPRLRPRAGRVRGCAAR
jgi:hypothetical protein